MNTFSIVLLYYKVSFNLQISVDFRLIVKMMIKIIFQYIKKTIVIVHCIDGNNS